MDEQDFDPNSYYRLTTQWLGDNTSLSAVSEGTDINVNITPTGGFNDQRWKITPLINGFYRLTTQWFGDDSSLDVLNDNQFNDQIIHAPTGNYHGQY